MKTEAEDIARALGALKRERLLGSLALRSHRGERRARHEQQGRNGYRHDQTTGAAGTTWRIPHCRARLRPQQ